jgi:nucleoside-diphosphate-sugar epimerase
MKLFVTGGSGFIGKNFIKKCLKKNFFIYAVSRKKHKNKKNLIWLKGNISDDWSKYLKDSQILIHLNSAGVKNQNLSFKIMYNANVLMLKKLLRQSIKAKCLKWIIAGSASEFGDTAKLESKLNINSKSKPRNNYEITKALVTKLCISLAKKNNVKCRIMRIFPTYGKGENKKRLYPSLLKAIKQDKNFILKNALSKASFIPVANVIKILIDSLNFKKNNKKFPQIWHVASPRHMSVKDFAKKIWNRFSLNDKLIINKKSFKKKYFYISDTKSIWKI